MRGFLLVDPMSDERPNLTPYNFMSNNPIMRIDPDGRKDGFFEKIGNWLSGNGWNTNREIADAKWQKEYYEEAGNEVLDVVDVIRSKPRPKQKYGEKVHGSSNEQLLEAPDAEITGDSQELFSMRGAPGKASGIFSKNWQKE